MKFRFLDISFRNQNVEHLLFDIVIRSTISNVNIVGTTKFTIINRNAIKKCKTTILRWNLIRTWVCENVHKSDMEGKIVKFHVVYIECGANWLHNLIDERILWGFCGSYGYSQTMAFEKIRMHHVHQWHTHAMQRKQHQNGININFRC